MMHCRLFQQDCVAGMAELPAACVDVVVTSPPYNLGINYRSYADGGDRNEYLAWTTRWTGALRRVLKADGSFFLNLGAAPGNPLLPHQVALLLSGDWILQNTFHWIKSITVTPKDGEPLSVGHFKPINSQRYVTDCHEYVFHFTKTGKVPLDRLAIGVPYADKSNIARWGHTGGRDKRCRGNNWFIPYRTINSRAQERPHPATFTPELAEHCIRLHAGDTPMTVMDPFLGLGNTLAAARDCGMAEFIGYEIDEYYFREASAR